MRRQLRKGNAAAADMAKRRGYTMDPRIAEARAAAAKKEELSPA
jgi:hypothetical protein